MNHVMNYQEIIEASRTGAIIYEEMRTTGIVRPLKFDGVDFIGVKHSCCLPLNKCNDKFSDYNLFYRCWGEEPSEELMNSTPWRENPYEE